MSIIAPGAFSRPWTMVVGVAPPPARTTRLADSWGVRGRPRGPRPAPPPAVDELQDLRPAGAGGGRNEQGLARLHAADHPQADPGREPRRAERAQVGLGGDARDVDL